MATIKGVWKFESIVATPSFKAEYCSFISNGVSYTNLGYSSYDSEYDRAVLKYGSTVVYYFDSGFDQWLNEAYRTVDFGETEQSVSDTFYNWLTANATQQPTASATLDLTTLGLGAGTYSITVRAKADGYNDSAVSNAVSYTVAAKGYTVTVNDQNGFGNEAPEVFQMDTINGEREYLGVCDSVGGSVTVTVTKPYVYVNTGGHVSCSGGISYTGTPYFAYAVTGDGVINVQTTCLTGDTLVTMADGSEKRIDEIELGEEVLSYDFATMTLVPNKVVYTDKDAGKTHTEYDVWTFSDGSFVKTVHRHRFYNVERRAFVYMDEWQMGEHTVRKDGEKVALVSHERVEETVNHYKITGEKGTNYFANGLLTGDRRCPDNIEL